MALTKIPEVNTTSSLSKIEELLGTSNFITAYELRVNEIYEDDVMEYASKNNLQVIPINGMLIFEKK